MPGHEFPVLLIAQANRFTQRCPDCAIARRFPGTRRGFLASPHIRPTGGHHVVGGDGIGWLARAWAIADCRESCLKLLLDKLGVSCRQRVLGRKIAMCPDGRIIGRIDGSKLPDQPLPQACRLLRRENGSCGAYGGLSAIPGRPLRSCSVAVRLAAMIGSQRLLEAGFWYGAEIRRIEVIFPGNPDQREEGVSAGIGERRAHALRRAGVADRANRPIRRQPFTGSVGEHGRQSYQASVLIDLGRLHSRDLMPAQALAHDFKTARQRRIAERPVGFPREG